MIWRAWAIGHHELSSSPFETEPPTQHKIQSSLLWFCLSETVKTLTLTDNQSSLLKVLHPLTSHTATHHSFNFKVCPYNPSLSLNPKLLLYYLFNMKNILFFLLLISWIFTYFGCGSTLLISWCILANGNFLFSLLGCVQQQYRISYYKMPSDQEDLFYVFKQNMQKSVSFVH